MKKVREYSDSGKEVQKRYRLCQKRLCQLSGSEFVNGSGKVA